MSDSYRPRFVHRFLAAALTATLVACGSAPVSRTLVIIPSAPEVGVADARGEGPAHSPVAGQEVAVLAIKLPEHWQRRGVLHLQGDAELKAWPDAIWAERVEVGMTRRLSQALRQRAPEFGWWPSDGTQASRRLIVDVQQLDVMAQRGQLVSVLHWRLIDRQGRVLGAGSLSPKQDVRVSGAQEQAQALGAWLDNVAEAIASGVRNVSDAADKTTSLR